MEAPEEPREVLRATVVHLRTGLHKIWLTPNVDKPPSSRVFVGPPASQKDRGEKGPYGLNDDISDDDLRSFFMHFGAVTEIRQHR